MGVHLLNVNAKRTSTPAKPDPRPVRGVRLGRSQYRIRARAFVERARFCECGCGRRAHSIHHVVGGNSREDVPENWMALNGDGAGGCHGAYTSKQRVWDPRREVYIEPDQVAAGMRETMETRRLDVLAYVLTKKGQDWLDKRYGRRINVGPRTAA